MEMWRALDLVRSLEAGTLSATALARQIAERIGVAEPALGAFAHYDEALFLAQARTAGPGPLHGLPVAFKDIIDTADLPTEYGSPIYRGWRPRADAPIVTMTRGAGGVVLGKSATTEFAFLEPCGTRNPFNPDVTPGGSSSGSAAGVAAGLMPLAFGTQTGGSIIRPASYCGVAAMKPSFRLLPLVGVKAGAWTLDTLGLFGAGVEDVAFGLAAISGRDLRVDGADPGRPRIGVDRMAFAGTAEPEAEAALACAIAALDRAGATIVDVSMPEALVAAHEAHPTLYNYEGGMALAWEIAQHRDQLSDILLRHFVPATPIGHAAYDRARGIARRARRAAKDWFGGFDGLLTFAATGPAPDKSSTGQAVFNRLFTLLGTPCINVPGYRSAAGLPVGVQVVTGFGKDKNALEIAGFTERALERYS